MQGKLVEQDESDGTAEELINQILEEKKKLMAEGKIKKEKLSRIYKNPTDNHYYEKFEDGKKIDVTNQIYYEIPSEWEYVRLKNISSIISKGTTPRGGKNAYIEKCLWKTDEFGTANLNELKIDSEVATDNDKEEFLEILKTGEVRDNQKSKYANNYRFFQKKIEEFLNEYLDVFSYLPIRILNNCILLPIEADNQNTALRIFSTLNDRGLPLSDADIFKAQFYKYYSAKGEKDAFIKKWKELEETCEKIFKPQQGTPMDELFTRYMYFERAKQGNKSSTTEALRKFYEKDDYAILKKEQTLDNLSALADFWNDIANQDEERFSKKILRKLFILNYAPNGMWNYFVSVYFMQNKDPENQLDEEKFYNFLDTIIPFIWAYAYDSVILHIDSVPLFSLATKDLKSFQIPNRMFPGFLNSNSSLHISFLHPLSYVFQHTQNRRNSALQSQPLKTIF